MTDASAPPARAFEAWRDALVKLKLTWRPLFCVHIIFALLGLVVFAPLTGLAGRLLLMFSGAPAVADQDIAWFLLSPAGLLALTFFAGLLIGILAFEQSAMMCVVLGELADERPSAFSALRFTSTRIPRLLRFATHLSCRVLLIVLPFLGVAGALAWWLISDYDINYYLARRPPEFIKAAAMIAAVLVAMAVALIRKLLDWSFALPLVLFEDAPPGRSFAASQRRTRGLRLRISGSLALWAILWLAITATAIAAFRLFGAWVVPPFASDLDVLLVVLASLALLLGCINLVTTSFTSGHFAAIIALFYFRVALPDGRRPELASGQGAWPALLTPARVTLGLVVSAAIALLSSAWLIEDVAPKDRATIVAHRGAAGRAPENTLASVRAAIDDQADWIEIDVQETADGNVVVMHDSDFMKLAGNPVKTWEATAEELSNLDIGSWFGDEFAGERVPTLAQVLQTVKGRASLVIELKYYGHDQMLEERVANIVEAAGMADAVAIMSLKYDAVRKMKTIRPDWTVGLLSATAIGDLSRLDADFLAVSSNMASAGFIRRAHAAGKQVFAWTVNDPVTMSRVLSLGVDGVITDEPAMAREVMADRADMSSAERLLLYAAMFFGRDFAAREYRDSSP